MHHQKTETKNTKGTCMKSPGPLWIIQHKDAIIIIKVKNRISLILAIFKSNISDSYTNAKSFITRTAKIIWQQKHNSFSPNLAQNMSKNRCTIKWLGASSRCSHKINNNNNKGTTYWVALKSNALAWNLNYTELRWNRKIATKNNTCSISYIWTEQKTSHSLLLHLQTRTLTLQIKIQKIHPKINKIKKKARYRSRSVAVRN